MKKCIVPFLFNLALFFNNHTLFAEQLITLFLKPYPTVSPAQVSKKLAAKIHRPGKMASNQMKNILPPSISGLFATYGGYLTVSDLNGEISFPRKTSEDSIYFIVTEKLTPIIMTGNTIHHWEFQEGAPIEMYKMEQKWDAQTNTYYWEVTQEPPPADKRVPLVSMVLFADPNYVYVPLGISLFKDSPHLILPDIYIKKGSNLTATALYILNLSLYYGAIIPMYKKEAVRYSRQLTY